MYCFHIILIKEHKYVIVVRYYNITTVKYDDHTENVEIS